MKKVNELLEIRRGIFHMVGGLILVFVIFYLQHSKIILFGASILFAILFVLAKYTKVPGITRALCLLERKCNKNYPGKGMVLYIISGFLVSLFLPKEIAAASILVLAFGDPIAGFVGRNFGSFRIGKKSMEGTLAGIVAGTIAASFLITPEYAFAGALGGMLIELVGVRLANVSVDDNLAIPIAASLAIIAVNIIMRLF